MNKNYFKILIAALLFAATGLCAPVQADSIATADREHRPAGTPALIPLPSSVQWHPGFFTLAKCSTLVVKDESLLAEARHLQQVLAERGHVVEIRPRAGKSEPVIELHRIPDQASQNSGGTNVPAEYYRIQVTEYSIKLSAQTAHGIFNGIQTLRQLLTGDRRVPACDISDQPAFAWRGYMIDVGRNYMSMRLLKQQIDVMAKYKFNVFHFHATEDIAWRLASRRYPQLTASDNMLRNKGMYYSEAEIRELIAYCRERHILFLPEIDMPGHSAAFSRAMKTDMQSDSGMQFVKNILKEFFQTYDLPFIHIGADEVKITNQRFLPEINAYLDSLGKRVIGWQPGGNFTDNTIRQLWMTDHGLLKDGKPIQYIDSRHLYLNHMDPLETVSTLFGRQLCDKVQGDSMALGATLCTWHDRAVSGEEDVLNMNAVYPGMLAFAERSWRGGGQPGWVANMDDLDQEAFIDFENRLLHHKKHWFGGMPFPYVQQSQLGWKLLGPYSNEGIWAKSFEPEQWTDAQLREKEGKLVKGGTVVLRHWWAPLIKGAVDQPKENSTFYATTTIWSDTAGRKDFWIGFNNLSRSTATHPPPPGGWDTKGSAVWVNGVKIDPPIWRRGGQQGHSEIPLVDEGYEYREAVSIHLNKGQNTVLLKLPVGSFKGSDWQNPVKWMFTFVPVE